MEVKRSNKYLEDFFEHTLGLQEALKSRYEDWEGVRQFEGTDLRVARMYEELCWTTEHIERDLDKHFKSVFPDQYDEMLVKPGIVVYTLCPHHLLPVRMSVTIGYIPNGKVLGLSKFVRVADTLGRRPVIQEEYSRELAEVIESRLTPKGVAVYVVGLHNCMAARGVKQEVPAVTSVVKGAIAEQPATRAEFFAIAGGSRWLNRLDYQLREL